jgi:L-ascorbate metabolism protein UlaG (beta-lactamase superfamily)
MPTVTVRRLVDSCVIVDDGEHAVLFDPGIYTWQHPRFSIDEIVWLDRILVTHSHADHCHPEFVVALADRFPDVAIQSNAAVVGALAAHGVAVTAESEPWIEAHDSPHERTPMGEGPPNTAFHVGGWFTHPGDSRRLDRSAQVLAVPMMPPWSSMTEAIDFANRLGPRWVVPIHDWNLNDVGRAFVDQVAPASLDDGITYLGLDHFESVDLDL